eukprot:g31069.t1
MNVVAITKEKVLRKLKGLKVDKSPRLDGRQPKVLKEIVVSVEALISERSPLLESGRVPEDCKIANVIPLFKKEGRQKTGNYRPVSFSWIVGKILKSTVKDEIAEYLEVHCKMGLSQHHFIKG